MAERPDLDELLRRSVEAVKAMSPEERAAMHEAQRQSWVRAFTTPCEHGELDFEQCGDCRAKTALPSVDVTGGGA
jgi:hypothetical protein